MANICSHSTPNRRWEAETERVLETLKSAILAIKGSRKENANKKQAKERRDLSQIRQKVRTYTRVILWSHMHQSRACTRVHSRECVHMTVYTYMHTAQREDKQA